MSLQCYASGVIISRVIPWFLWKGYSSGLMEGDFLDSTEGNPIDCLEGDSSCFTPDDCDTAVQPTKHECTKGDSSDFTLDELSTLIK